MITLINQEFFKLGKRKTTWILPVIALLIMTLAAIMSKRIADTAIGQHIDNTGLFIDLFTGTTWVMYLMIFAGSTLVTQEFEFGTIKNLLYRKYSRGQILVSKWLTLLALNLSYFVIIFVYALILKMTLFPKIKLTAISYSNHLLVENVLLTILGTFLTTWLVLSLVVMISTLFKNSAVAVSFGIVFYFGATAAGMFQVFAIERWHWMRWNPLNMMNLQNQISVPEMQQGTLLDIPSMLIATMIYIIIFLAVGYYAFTKRKNY